MYLDAAGHVGRLLGEGGHELVWGGASVGSMGVVARATQSAGGKVYGVIPSDMIDRELAFAEADELVVTATMRQRKELMEARADAFAVLPGGFGTLEEAFEIITLRGLGYHRKPVAFLDVDGFWQPLLRLIDHLEEQDLSRPAYRDAFRVFTDPGELVAHLVA